jgi:hypothetical protein
VDPRYQQEIYSALKQVLSSEIHARVELLPSGQILVNASVQTLEQVDQVLQAIRSRPVAAAPRAELRYWAVLGRPTPDSTANAPQPAVPSVLNGVLAELERAHGNLTFQVLSTAALVTESGQFGEVGGALAIEQKAYIQGDSLTATVSMALHANAIPVAPGAPIMLMSAPGAEPQSPAARVAVATTLQRGEFVVLGESDVRTGMRVAGQRSGPESMLGVGGPVFFIVHWVE